MDLVTAQSPATLAQEIGPTQKKRSLAYLDVWYLQKRKEKRKKNTHTHTHVQTHFEIVPKNPNTVQVVATILSVDSMHVCTYVRIHEWGLDPQAIYLPIIYADTQPIDLSW